MNWRPDCWVNPHDFRNPDHVDNPYVEMECANSYEQGASDMLSAVLVYLDEPCTEHPYSVFGSGNLSRMYSHRKDCPQCMASLREVGQ